MGCPSSNVKGLQAFWRFLFDIHDHFQKLTLPVVNHDYSKKDYSSPSYLNRLAIYLVPFLTRQNQLA